MDSEAKLLKLYIQVYTFQMYTHTPGAHIFVEEGLGLIDNSSSLGKIRSVLLQFN